MRAVLWAFTGRRIKGGKGEQEERFVERGGRGDRTGTGNGAGQQRLTISFNIEKKKGGTECWKNLLAEGKGKAFTS